MRHITVPFVVVSGQFGCLLENAFVNEKLKDETFIKEQIECLLSDRNDNCDDTGKLLKRKCNNMYNIYVYNMVCTSHVKMS